MQRSPSIVALVTDVSTRRRGAQVIFFVAVMLNLLWWIGIVGSVIQLSVITFTWLAFSNNSHHYVRMVPSPNAAICFDRLSSG